MKIMDAEYQFDRTKLTITYIAENRVDFREMVRDLFSRFKVRIWMKQLFEYTARLNSSSSRYSTQKSYTEGEKHVPSYNTNGMLQQVGTSVPSNLAFLMR